MLPGESFRRKLFWLFHYYVSQNGVIYMKYAIITKDIQSLRSIQTIIEKREKAANIFMECDLVRAMKDKRFREIDVLIVEAGSEMDSKIGHLVNRRWEDGRPEVILMLSCWSEDIFRKIEKLFNVFLLNVPFEINSAEKVIEKAVNSRKQYLHYSRLRKQANYLENHKQVIQQQFWTRLLSGQISLDPSYFLAEAINCGVEIHLEDSFHIAVMSRKLIKERNIEVEQESRTLLLNAGNEWFSSCDGDYVLVEQLRPILVGRNIPNEEFVYECEEFIKNLEEKTGIPLCIYYDAGIYCENLLSRLHYVMLAEKKDWVETPGVYPAVVQQLENEKDVKIMLPGQIETYLQNGYYLAAIQTVENYLTELAANGEVSSGFLRALRLDMEQVIMCVLREKSVSAHKILMDKVFKDLTDNAHISIESFMTWFRVVLEHFPQNENVVSQVEEIQQYVKTHIYENITREDLAKHLYVNPDYMSRQYKHNTGETLGHYITREKMKKAAEILISSNKSVGDVGIMLGFSNFAHFSKLFKRVMGCTPKEYRIKKWI